MLICDTSVLYAAIDPRDDTHGPCSALLRTARDGIALAAPVIVEVDWIGRSRGRPDAGAHLLRSLDDGSLLIVNLDEVDYRRARELLETYDDLPLEFVDAAVIAVAERLEEDTIATLDRRHFSVVKPLHCESFTLVP
jgi:predicted nucleic acid-binding protein